MQQPKRECRKRDQRERVEEALARLTSPPAYTRTQLQCALRQQWMRGPG